MAKILVVDDDPDIVETSRLVLEKVGHQVFSAHSRTEGLKAYKEYAPDLIMLDVMMDEPDDGIAMAQDLRRMGCTKPILMLTSLDRVTGFKYDKDSGLVPVDDYHEKPMDPAKLVARVAELLKR